MKKLLLSVLAISALVACSKSDVIEMPQSQAIKFGSAFVDNSTKVIDNSSTTDNLTSFKVWGKLTPDGTTNTNIFNGVDVTKSGSGIGTTWFYNEGSVQYWIPTVQYQFAAIAGLNSNYTSISTNTADGMPTVVNGFDISTQSDLMYDGPIAKVGQSSGNDEVAFNFNHLLSKVKLQFFNSFPQVSNLYVTVEDVKIINAYKTADCTLGNYNDNNSSDPNYTPTTLSTWNNHTKDSYDHEFGHAVSSDFSVETSPITPAAYITPNNKVVDATSSKTEVLSGVTKYSRLMIPGVYSKTGSTNPLQISFVAKVWLKQGSGSTATFTEIKALRKNFTNTKSTDLGLTDADPSDARGYLTVSYSDAGVQFSVNNSYNLNITIGETLQEIKFKLETVRGWENGEAIADSDVDYDTEIN